MRVEADREAGRQLRELLEREQDARHERVARERVVADRQQLALARRAAPPGGRRGPGAARSGSAGRPPSPPRSPSRCPTARPSSPRCGARRSRRAAGASPPRRRSASSARRRSRSSARRRRRRPASGRRVDPVALASQPGRPDDARHTALEAALDVRDRRVGLGEVDRRVAAVRHLVADSTPSTSWPAASSPAAIAAPTLPLVAEDDDLHAAAASPGWTRSTPSRKRSSPGPDARRREPRRVEQHAGQLGERRRRRRRRSRR